MLIRSPDQESKYKNSMIAVERMAYLFINYAEMRECNEKLITFHFDIGNRPTEENGSNDNFFLLDCTKYVRADRFHINYSFFDTHHQNVNFAAL